MEEKNNTMAMTELDSLIVGRNLQIIKTIIPYIGISEQRFLSIFVKFQELQSTIHFFQPKGDDSLSACSIERKSGSLSDILNEIKVYCTEQEKESIDLMINFTSAFQIYNTYQASVNREEGTEKTTPMDALKSLLSPEQQSMMETYMTMMNTI